MSLPAAYVRLHADATRLLTGLTPDSTDQQAERRTMLHHLAAHPDAMWRDGPPEHFTASCVVFDRSGEHVLLVLHGKAKRWLQPGGHFEEGDVEVAATALREVHEETGLSVDLVDSALVLDRHELPGAFGRCTAHLDLRFVAVTDRLDPTLSAESDKVAWWPVADLPADDDPADAAELHHDVGEAHRLAWAAGAFPSSAERR